MTLCHELGHLICGWACGGALQAAELRPWHMPYSIFEPDPYPLVTLWGGPCLGVVIPLCCAGLVRREWMWFIAYFCVLANGTYLATGWLSGDRYLDTQRLLAQNAHPLALVAYCLLTIGIGYIGFRQCCMRGLTPAARNERPSDAEEVTP